MIRNDVNHNLLSNKQLNAPSISSLDTFNPKDDYSLNISRRSSYNSADADVRSQNSSNATANALSTGNYNSTNGYGLINAA
ncbi:MAG: peptidase S8, partial [Nostoc sp.]